MLRATSAYECDANSYSDIAFDFASSLRAIRDDNVVTFLIIIETNIDVLRL